MLNRTTRAPPVGLSCYRVLVMVVAISSLLIIMIVVGSSSSNSNMPTVAFARRLRRRARFNLRGGGGDSHVQCGKPNPPPAHEQRIIGGELSYPNEYPWLVWIVTPVKPGLVASCGGSLVSDRHVITAAHCATDTRQSTLFFGLYDRRNGGVKAQIRSVVYASTGHYNPATWQFDFAILRLNAPVRFSSAVRPLCLPTKAIGSNSLVGRTLIVAGWGRQWPSANAQPSDMPRFARVQVAPLNLCMRQFADSHPPVRVGPSNLCVANFKTLEGPCNGDSGGPATLVDSNGIHTLVGVVSFGSLNCSLHPPFVFSRVDRYLNLIRNFMRTY